MVATQFENHPQADKAIKDERLFFLADAVLKQIIKDPDTICETADFGFSQTRKFGLSTDIDQYFVTVKIIVEASVIRPNKEDDRDGSVDC